MVARKEDNFRAIVLLHYCFSVSRFWSEIDVRFTETIAINIKSVHEVQATSSFMFDNVSARYDTLFVQG